MAKTPRDQAAPKPDMGAARSNPTRTPKPSTPTKRTGDVAGSEVSTGGEPRRG